MGQKLLSALTIVPIENELLETINFSDIVFTFTDQKNCARHLNKE